MSEVRDFTEMDDEKWRAVLDRNPCAQDAFVYAVQTTGIYCRPGCSARTPKRKNIEYFDTPIAAESKGFRACKRCQPNLPAGARATLQAERDIALVKAACQDIEKASERPVLAELAARSGLSPFHFHRVFKRSIGLTPAKYWNFHQQRSARDQLATGISVTEAIYAASYGSSGRFYEAAPAMLGMKPATYRKGGEGETISTTFEPCSLGHALIAATRRGVCAVLLGNDIDLLTEDLARRFSNATIVDGDDRFKTWVQTVLHLIDHPADPDGASLPLDMKGTIFQQRVWAGLRKIPPGETVTYGALAQGIGEPKAVRAVAAACGANPVAVVVPCHRVVGASGALTGYRWGIDRKRDLLAREKK